MNYLLDVITAGALDIWCLLRGKQRDLDESSVVGRSEFEKEGSGPWWLLFIGVGLLMTVFGVVLLR